MPQASNTIDYLAGPIYATLYIDGELVDRNMKVDLPNWEYQSVDIPAMGTMNVPLPGLYNDAQIVFYPTNATKKSAKLMAPGTHDYDLRFNQIEYEENTANQKTVTHRYLGRGTPMAKHLGGTVERGTKPDRSVAWAIFNFNYYCAGELITAIDRFSQQDEHLGVNYTQDYMMNL